MKTRTKVDLSNNVRVGLPLFPSLSVQMRYTRALEDLVNYMAAHTETAIRKLFEKPHVEEYFAQDASVSVAARILTNALTFRFDKLFAEKAQPTAEAFVKQSDDSARLSVQASINHMTGGQSLTIGRLELSGPLKEVFTASVAENVGLIKSIASQYLAGVQGAVMRSITTGNGLQDLEPFLAKHKGITLRRAHTIALDQTRKAHSALTKLRMDKLGVDKYRWLHSQGSNHPRLYHKNVLNGKTFSNDNPPVIDEKTGERGGPGDLINCRCVRVPVSRFLNYEG